MHKTQEAKSNGLEACMILNLRYNNIPKEKRIFESDNSLMARGYPILDNDLPLGTSKQLLLFKM